MVFIGEFNYKFDTILDALKMADQFWSRGRHLDATLVLLETIEVIKHYEITVPDFLRPEQIQKKIEQFFREDDQLETRLENRKAEFSTGKIRIKFLGFRKIEKIVSKANNLWNDHNFEKALEVLRYSIERVIGDEKEEDLEQLFSLYHRFRKEWSDYLLDLVEKQFNSIVRGEKRFSRSSLNELEHLVVRAFKLAPSGNDGRSGINLIKTFNLINTYRKSRECLNMIDNGFLETAILTLEELELSFPIEAVKTLLSNAALRQDQCENILDRLERALEKGNFELSERLLNSAKKLNKENKRLKEIEPIFNDFQNTISTIEAARSAMNQDGFEKAAIAARMLLISNPKNEIAKHLLQEIQTDYEAFILNELQRIDKPDSALHLIQQFRQTFELPEQFEKILHSLKTQISVWQKTIEECQEDIAANRFSIAKEKLKEIPQSVIQNQMFTEMMHDINRGEEGIRLYNEAKKCIHQNKIKDAVKYCSESLSLVSFAAANKLMNSIKEYFGLRHDFTIDTGKEIYIILKGNHFSMGRCEKGHQKHHIFLYDYPLDVSREKQAEFFIDGSDYYIEDNQSPFGTFVDGNEIERKTRLNSIAMIRFGNHANYHWKITKSLSSMNVNLTENISAPSAYLQIARPEGIHPDDFNKIWPNFYEMAKFIFVIMGEGITIGTASDATIKLSEKEGFQPFVCAIHNSSLGICQITRLSDETLILVDGIPLHKETHLTVRSSIKIGDVVFTII